MVNVNWQKPWNRLSSDALGRGTRGLKKKRSSFLTKLEEGGFSRRVPFRYDATLKVSFPLYTCRCRLVRLMRGAPVACCAQNLIILCFPHILHCPTTYLYTRVNHTLHPKSPIGKCNHAPQMRMRPLCLTQLAVSCFSCFWFHKWLCVFSDISRCDLVTWNNRVSLLAHILTYSLVCGVFFFCCWSDEFTTKRVAWIL